MQTVLRRSSHMAEAPLLAEDDCAKFYEIDKPVINFEGRVNEIQHIQRSMMEVAEEQAKDKVWSEVISWVEKGQLLEKAETRGKTREVLAARSLFDPAVFKMNDRVYVGYRERKSILAEDSFSRYCRAYPIPNKEARTVVKVLVDQHFNVYGLPDQLH